MRPPIGYYWAKNENEKFTKFFLKSFQKRLTRGGKYDKLYIRA